MLYDDLQARQPATFQFMLHALSPFQVDAPHARLRLQRPEAGADMQYLATAPLTFRQWDGYDPPPTRDFPNQWHVEAATPDPHPEVAVFTVIAPYRGSQPREWSAEQVETEATRGVRIVWESGTTTVEFPRHESKAKLRVVSDSGR